MLFLAEVKTLPPIDVNFLKIYAAELNGPGSYVCQVFHAFPVHDSSTPRDLLWTEVDRDEAHLPEGMEHLQTMGGGHAPKTQ